MVGPVEQGDAVSPSKATADTKITAKVLALVRKLAIDHAGRESEGMRAADRLQGHDERESFLREMVMSFQPPEADPELWLRWLSGGAEPFAPHVPQKPHMSQVSTKREIQRASKRVAAARAGVEKVERELAAAQSAVASCVEFESSLITWALMERITSLVSPIFAMGPAWTLMRVVSPHVYEAEMEEELVLEDDPRARVALEKTVKQERVDLSNTLHAALDLWAGDKEFEGDLRRSIEQVVKKHQGRECTARADGRKVRSQSDARRSVRPDLAATHHEVLGDPEEFD